MPDSANTKQADHYAQMTISKKFQRYDYGEKQNRIVYKNEKPPEYPLEDITVPFHIIYGTRDTFFGSKVINLQFKHRLYLISLILGCRIFI